MTPTPMTPLTEDELAELERLAQEATPGPWFVERLGEGDEDDWYNIMSNAAGPQGLGMVSEASPRKEDARFVAAVRNRVARLLSEVRARRAAPDRIEADAAGVGLRTALSEIHRAVQILDESEWSKLSREKFTELVRRAFTVLCNAAELTRACFVASVPCEPPLEGASERDEKGAKT